MSNRLSGSRLETGRIAGIHQLTRPAPVPLDAARLRVERIADEDALAALVPEWEALHGDISPRTPFSSPHWNVLWWKHLSERRLFVADELFVHAIRSEDGRLIAVAPMVLTRRPGRGPGSLRALQFFGVDANVTELRGPVCRAEHEAVVFEVLRNLAYAHEGEWDWVHWRGLRGGEGVWSAVDPSRLAAVDTIPDYYLELPASWEEFRAGLSRNIKESLRKCYNSLKRDGHTFEFRVVESESETPAAMRTFFELHAARAALSGTVTHADVFSTPRARTFLERFSEDSARRGTLRVFQLVIDGRVVASRVGFALGDELYLYFSGYDPAWGRYSVMTTAVAESIRFAIAQRFRVVNLSPGADVSKLRWGPREVRFSQAVEISRNPRSRFAFEAYMAVVKATRASSRFHTALRAIGRRR